MAIVHGFERAHSSTRPSQAIHVLAMELIEGPTLADRISEGPIPLDEALPMARQIAEALEAARGLSFCRLTESNSSIESTATPLVCTSGRWMDSKRGPYQVRPKPAWQALVMTGRHLVTE